MLIWSLLQYPPTTACSKLPRPRRQTNSLGYCVMLATCLPSLAANTSASHFQARRLVYRSLHNTYPTYLSSLLHAYTPTRPLRSSSAHLLVEPRLRTTFASRGFRSAGPRIWNSLSNDIALAPLSPRSHPNSKLTSLL